MSLAKNRLQTIILNNWDTDIDGYAQSIEPLKDTKYPAWTIKYDNSYGVAIPYDGEDDINESFSKAKILSRIIHFKDGVAKKALVLTSESSDMKISFATLCEALVDPGENGERRVFITKSPIQWWKEWKELLGNKSIDERIYDVLGELCTLKMLVFKGEDPEWNGPNGASYDIETETRFVEVKSSINRDRREVTISSQFQLFPKEKPLDLILCRFEPVVFAGISIDSIMAEFEESGYNTSILNSKLELLGFEQGMSARKKNFKLHEMLLYKIDDSFPRITPESFVGGVMPNGILKITYTVDLSGLTPLSQLYGDNKDV